MRGTVGEPQPWPDPVLGPHTCGGRDQKFAHLSHTRTQRPPCTELTVKRALRPLTPVPQRCGQERGWEPSLLGTAAPVQAPPGPEVPEWGGIAPPRPSKQHRRHCLIAKTSAAQAEAAQPWCRPQRPWGGSATTQTPSGPHRWLHTAPSGGPPGVPLTAPQHAVCQARGGQGGNWTQPQQSEGSDQPAAPFPRRPAVRLSTPVLWARAGAHCPRSSGEGPGRSLQAELPAWHPAECTFLILTRMQTNWTGLARWQCQPQS